MLDCLQLIQNVLNLGEGKKGNITIFDKDGYIELHRNLQHPDSQASKSYERSIIGRHVLEIYQNLSEEESSVMEALRTGKPARRVQQVLIIDENRKRGPFNALTIPILINGEIMGAIDYTITIKEEPEDETASGKDHLYTIDSIITEDKAMIQIKEQITRMAWSDSPVFIYGETGTGKELVAEALHSCGKRWDEPFISQNCAAIPANLLESIFFGTEKGSFTGAESKAGLFELANHGTLFLDEINSMDLMMQVKLLKALEEKKVRRIGGNRDISFDVRIICATNEPPDELLQTGKLRQDLYYRIGVVSINIPPLRERKGDIPLLVDHFIKDINKKMHRKEKVKGISDIVMQIFLGADWPGNVRELRNVIEGAFNVTRGNQILINDIPQFLWKANRHSDYSSKEIPEYLLNLIEEGPSADAGRSHLPAEILSPRALEQTLDGDGISLQELLDQCEEYLIREALEHEKKLYLAAEKLSISPQKLHYRMKRLGMGEEKLRE